jgi:hypothetical protein
LTVCAVDESGCVSPAASFKGIVEGSDPSEAVLLNDRDSVLILPRKTASEVIESWHNQCHPSLLGQTDFSSLSYYRYRGHFDFDAEGVAFTYPGFTTLMRIDEQLSDSPPTPVLHYSGAFLVLGRDFQVVLDCI